MVRKTGFVQFEGHSHNERNSLKIGLPLNVFMPYQADFTIWLDPNSKHKTQG